MSQTSINSSPSPADLLACSAVAAFAIDPRHQVIYWNSACEKLTGLAADEMMGTSNHWRAFYPTERPCLADIVISGALEELPFLYGTFTKSALNADGLHAEGWYDVLGGKKRYIIFDAVPVYNEAGELLAVAETLQDVTDARIREEGKDYVVGKLRAMVRDNSALQGYVPICSTCKGIHDADGRWVPVDVYLLKYADIRFTHGICPPCAEKLYPEFFGANGGSHRPDPG